MFVIITSVCVWTFIAQYVEQKISKTAHVWRKAIKFDSRSKTNVSSKMSMRPELLFAGLALFVRYLVTEKHVFVRFFFQ